jgi:LysR family transcriptional regulator, benzoate and cis,cis-muconate-responsive activator of ben and cat genes
MNLKESSQHALVARAIASVTLRQLQYFVAVAELEHFTRASEKLLVAQPALSRQVKELEEALGVQLLVRDTRRVRLTAPGSELLRQGRAILEHIEQAVESVHAAARGRSDRLRIGYYGAVLYSNEQIEAAVDTFRATYPDLELTVHELSPDRLAQALLVGELDLVLARGENLLPEIESRTIALERLCVVLPAGDPLAKKHALRLADLDGRGVIEFSRDNATTIVSKTEKLAQTAHVNLPIVHEAMHVHSIFYHVAHGDGIAFLIRVPSNEQPGIAVRALVDAEASVKLTAWTKRGTQNAVAETFLAIVAAEPQKSSVA